MTADLPAIYQEIEAHHADGNDLVTPGFYTPGGNGQGSDNGPMYTAEFYIILAKMGYPMPDDFLARIMPCVNNRGVLRRVPDPTPPGQSNRQVGPDDYLGVLNASKQLGITSLPRTFLKATFRGLGSLNNESPGAWSWRSFLIRQPQLIAAMVSAAFPSKWNPMHIAVRLLAAPAYIYTALVIATSCRGKEVGDTDSRRLAWHLTQLTKEHSLLCMIASKIWYARLYKDYGPEPMRAVAKIYYAPGHPFAKYWITE